MKDDILPKEKSEAIKVRRKAPRFWLSEDQKLYKRSVFRALPAVHTPEATKLLLEELHEGFTRAIPDVDFWHIEPSLKATGGQKCKRKHRNI